MFTLQTILFSIYHPEIYKPFPTSLWRLLKSSRMTKAILYILVTTCTFQTLHAQQKLQQLFSFSDAVQKKINILHENADKSFDRWLDKLQKEEQKLKNKLSKKDSTKAALLFGNVQQRFDSLRNLQGDSNSHAFTAYLDTLHTAAKFSGNTILQKQIAQLTNKLNAKEFIRQKIKERKQQLMNGGLGKQLAGFDKQAYYYSQQLNEFKSLIKNKKKREQKALEVLRESKLFKDFFAQHSELSRYFPMLTGNALPAGSASVDVNTRLCSIID
jgi:hypothetical protein